jgi:hypothetical protein
MKYWTELRPDWRDAPLAFWVHREVDAAHWRDACVFDPPAPKPAAAGMYVFLCIEFRRDVLVFSSEHQLAEFIRVMSLHLLPTTSQLSASRGSGAGPNSHWLSRLPRRLKATRAREVLVKQLEACRAQAVSQLARAPR